MLGVDYQHIYCDVKKCPDNEKHQVFDGNGKVIQTYYTCEREQIYINKGGVCRKSLKYT